MNESIKRNSITLQQKMMKNIAVYVDSLLVGKKVEKPWFVRESSDIVDAYKKRLKSLEESRKITIDKLDLEINEIKNIIEKLENNRKSKSKPRTDKRITKKTKKKNN